MDQCTLPAPCAPLSADEFTCSLLAARTPLLRQLRARIGGATRTWLDPEDVWQEVCVTALVVRPRFRWRGRVRFARWLRTVAMRQVLRAVRRQRRSPGIDPLQHAELLDLVHPQAGPAARVERDEQFARCLTALRQLPAPQQDVLVLHLLQGLDHRAVARHLGRLPETIRKSRYRALLTLRRLLRA